MKRLSIPKSRLILVIAALIAAGPVFLLALASDSPRKAVFGCARPASGWVRLVDEHSRCRPDEERSGFLTAPASERADCG